MISFSGIDCSGKSTQIEITKKYYESKGIRVRVIWSRGGYTSWVEGIKTLIRKDKRFSAAEKAEYRTKINENHIKARLLLWASILDLIRYYGIVFRWIEMSGAVILCDRYIWDTYIDFSLKYKNIEFEKWLCWKIMLKLIKKPDKSIIFTIPIEESMRRSLEKNDQHSEPFDERLSRIQRYMAEIENGRWQHVINASSPIQAVTNEVIKILERKSAIVFDVAAETGGALEILNGFYDAAAKEKDIDWELILSTPIFSDADNIHVKNYFWIKKSWLHRLVFDKVIAPKLCRGKSIDVVVSLQNIAVSAGRKKQMLYLHQSIPFSDIELSIRNNRVEFVYKHLISHLIFHSIRKADQVVVQTKWMRDAVCKKTGVDASKVLVSQPECKLNINSYYEDSEENLRSFFYPAANISYKNHKAIFEAVLILVERGITEFQVILTIDMQNNIQGYFLNDIPQILCVGSLPHDYVMKQYSKSTLIFPSKLETFGLPMLEAALVRSPIIASDMPFSHEILEGYPNVSYFKADSAESLAELMELQIKNKLKYEMPADDRWYYEKHRDAGWSSAFDLICRMADCERGHI